MAYEALSLAHSSQLHGEGWSAEGLRCEGCAELWLRELPGHGTRSPRGSQCAADFQGRDAVLLLFQVQRDFQLALEIHGSCVGARGEVQLQLHRHGLSGSDVT